MITFFLICLVISVGCNIAAVILIKRLLNKIDIYEEWVLDFKTDVIDTLEKMRDLDKQGLVATSVNDKGIFESDDQVGVIFKGLLDLIEKLNQRIQ